MIFILSQVQTFKIPDELNHLFIGIMSIILFLFALATIPRWAFSDVQLVSSGPGTLRPGENLNLVCKVTGVSISSSSYTWNWIRQPPGKAHLLLEEGLMQMSPGSLVGSWELFLKRKILRFMILTLSQGHSFNISNKKSTVHLNHGNYTVLVCLGGHSKMGLFRCSAGIIWARNTETWTEPPSGSEHQDFWQAKPTVHLNHGFYTVLVCCGDHSESMFSIDCNVLLFPGAFSDFQLVSSGPGTLRPGQNLHLVCKVTGVSIAAQYNYWDWARQPLGKGLEWVARIYPYAGDKYYAPSLQNRVAISADAAKNQFSLQLNSVTAADSAVYFCAKNHSETKSIESSSKRGT
uniref:Uncharacterized protein n=1 Tax=Sphaerodactylus townsendi TaxID=933632 RepID=A0ACB8EWA9_9SAUR